MISSLYDHFLLHSAISKGTVEPYSLAEILGYNISTSFCGGLFGGLFLTTLNQKTKNKPFLFGQIIGATSFLTIFIFLSFLTETISTYFEFTAEERSPGFQELFQGLTFDSLHFKNLIVWGIVFQLTQFYLQLQQKFGPGNMGKIFLGKYHTPKTESRVFMFLDLKSSTYIAEKLGESKYHEFLRDVFADITESPTPEFRCPETVPRACTSEFHTLLSTTGRGPTTPPVYLPRRRRAGRSSVGGPSTA